MRKMDLQEILIMKNKDTGDYITAADLSGVLPDIIDWAIRLKNDDRELDFKPLNGMTIGSIYEKPSTRTRVSFEVGISKLGGNALTLLSNDIQLGSSETIADTAEVLSRYLDCITYRCFSHSDVVELAVNSSIPVINALSDMHHPCQAAADLMTIVEHLDKLDGHIAWVGDGNNVLHDLVLASAIIGIDIKYATPKGLEPDQKIINLAKDIAKENGVHISQSNNPKEVVTGASVVYTDVFVSMGEEHMKSKFDSFEGFQVNKELVDLADKNYIFMHCLPAHRGEEVTDEVIDSKNSVVFDQAENRMWAQMSILTYLCNYDAWLAYKELL